MGPDTLAAPETVEFNGVVYRLMGGVRRYYLSQATTNEGRKGAKGLHVDVWEFFSGEKVPKGHNVHHEDGNQFNNDFSNLKCLPRGTHMRQHPVKDREKQQRHLAQIRNRAIEWHQSPAGLDWHRRMAAERQPMRDQSRECATCGSAFMAKSSRAKFCSQVCGLRYRYREVRGRNPHD